jgi:hypothetical protein
VDCDVTIKHVMKPTTVWIVLPCRSPMTRRYTSLMSKKAFLHSTLTKSVYCSQSVGFIDSTHLGTACKFNCSLYGHKQTLWSGIVAPPSTWSYSASMRPSQSYPFSSSGVAPTPSTSCSTSMSSCSWHPISSSSSA